MLHVHHDRFESLLANCEHRRVPLLLCLNNFMQVGLGVSKCYMSHSLALGGCIITTLFFTVLQLIQLPTSPRLTYELHLSGCIVATLFHCSAAHTAAAYQPSPKEAHLTYEHLSNRYTDPYPFLNRLHRPHDMPRPVVRPLACSVMVS